MKKVMAATIALIIGFGVIAWGQTFGPGSGGTSGGNGLTAPIVNFADNSSAAVTGLQTLASIVLPAGKMAANNDYAVLAITGVQTTSDNALTMSFGGTEINVGNNVTAWNLASTTTFTVECLIIRTGASAQKIACVSGLGQNAAYPYLAYTTGAENLSNSVTVAAQAQTNGNAGDVVLKTLELRPVNF